ncbi:energy transducer TonB [Tenacibaculum soleae]|uniref:hypothetical protein n=1 Tax=Tenacibaculum soleae TaxID=447689 RepID=UPI002301DE98|nr:hypothetical protein [Tenacibaculum soleae]MDO6745121.1 hypothetical protein [Tenacibaculum soleae]
MRFCDVIFAIILSLFLSCDSFFNKTKKDNFNSVIDFTKVDVSPAFKICNQLPINEKKACFYEEVTKRIQNSIATYKFITEETINDTVLIDLLVDKSGIFKLKEIKSSKKVIQQFPKLDSVLRASIIKLPQITPAYKRGVPVATQYKLPVRIIVKKVIY